MGETEKVVQEAEELPKAIVRRVVKDDLSRCSTDGDISIHKEALLAFSESARIFIHYLSATANDICKEAKRQIISADDVFKALEETEYSEFVRPLKASLEEFRKKNAGKKAGASKAKYEKKKRKLEDKSSDKDEGGDNKCEVWRRASKRSCNCHDWHCDLRFKIWITYANNCSILCCALVPSPPAQRARRIEENGSGFSPGFSSPDL